jgi:hypothetical protein
MFLAVGLGLLWVLGAATVLLALRRTLHPAPPVSAPAHAACPDRSARKE